MEKSELKPNFKSHFEYEPYGFSTKEEAKKQWQILHDLGYFIKVIKDEVDRFYIELKEDDSMYLIEPFKMENENGYVKPEYHGNKLGYANQYGYSDVHPFEIIEKRTDRKIMIRRMDSERDPSWKPITVLGGFVGHTTNNNEQRHLYRSNEEYPVIAMRLHNDTRWHSAYGRHLIAKTPVEFYDYNF